MPRKKKEPIAPATPAALTCASREQAVDQVMKWVIAGHAEFDIATNAAAQLPAFPVTELLAEVMTRLSRSAEFDRGLIIGWCFESYRDLYRRLVEAGDFPGALRAVKAILEMTIHVPDLERPLNVTSGPGCAEQLRGDQAPVG